MRFSCLAAGAVVFAACAAAQTPPAFEVASVRVVTTGGGRGEMHAPPARIQVEPGSLTIRNASFRTCVRWAYNVADYQVNGPDWIDQQRYDIVAKAGGGAAEGQLRSMLQALLAERFKLAVHRQTKEGPAWVLTVGKGGPKFKESTSEGESSVVPNQQRMQVVAMRTRVSELIDFLAPILRAPVIDETGLKGRYDVTIAVDKYLPDHATGISDMIPVLLNGIQQELGLKLDSRRMPLEYVIIDRAEKAPTEN